MPTPQQQRLQHAIDAFLPLDRPVRVLEAGCGSLTMVRLPADAYVVGIDVSQRQLDRNQVLHQKIHGDIQSHPIEPSSFDLIICWDVLEHVERPDLAISNLSRGLVEGGLLLLAMPNPLSVKGLLTKLTPHRFHLWTYRKIYGMPLAGVDGRGPFPTWLRLSAAPARVERLADSIGLEVIHRSLSESVFQERVRRRIGLGGWPWQAVCQAVSLVTGGRLSLNETEVGMILRRPVGRPTNVALPRSNERDVRATLPVAVNGQHVDGGELVGAPVATVTPTTTQVDRVSPGGAC
jgi:SAM-dependent methyltransferase